MNIECDQLLTINPPAEVSNGQIWGRFSNRPRLTFERANATVEALGAGAVLFAVRRNLASPLGAVRTPGRLLGVQSATATRAQGTVGDADRADSGGL
jgi:hypothetical protein